MKRQQVILKVMLKIGETFIMTAINKYFFLLFTLLIISCKEPQERYTISSWRVYHCIPSKAEWGSEYTEGNPLIYFLFDIKNATEKTFVFISEPFYNYQKVKSKTYLLCKGRLYPLVSKYQRVEFQPDSPDKYNYGVGLQYNSIYSGKTPREISLDSLLKKTEEIAKDGIVIYVPNIEDYKDLDTNKYIYIKEPLIIKRLSNNVIKREYIYKVKK